MAIAMTLKTSNTDRDIVRQRLGHRTSDHLRKMIVAMPGLSTRRSEWPHRRKSLDLDPALDVLTASESSLRRTVGRDAREGGPLM